MSEQTQVEYWKDLATQRSKALNTANHTLQEIRELVSGDVVAKANRSDELEKALAYKNKLLNDCEAENTLQRKEILTLAERIQALNKVIKQAEEALKGVEYFFADVARDGFSEVEGYMSATEKPVWEAVKAIKAQSQADPSSSEASK